MLVSSSLPAIAAVGLGMHVVEKSRLALLEVLVEEVERLVACTAAPCFVVEAVPIKLPLE